MTFKVYVFLRSAYPSDVFLIKIFFFSAAFFISSPDSSRASHLNLFAQQTPSALSSPALYVV